MPDERKGTRVPPGNESRSGTSGELDPARSKSVETVEKEVDDIVDALAERERARRDAPSSGEAGKPKA